MRKRLDFHKRIVRNAKRRENYHMKKYGNLNKLHEKEAEFQRKWDNDSWRDELIERGILNESER